MSEPQIRRATADDAPALTDLYLRARAAAEPAIPPGVHSPAEVAAWMTHVVLPTQEVWVAQDEDKDVDDAVLALLVLAGPDESGDPDLAWVEQLYVEPALTGHGIGSALLDLARKRHPAGLQLWCFATNTGARRFYERHGFVAVAHTDGDNEEGAPDVRYAWRPTSVP